MNIDHKMIGRQIKEKRSTLHMTQASLAELVELSVSYISCIERAKKQSSLETLVRIANALNTTVDDLLFGNQDHSTVALSSKWSELLFDCSNEEQVHLYNTAFALKNSLHTNKRTFL